ncbi:hypothetical protein [Heyndrickxia camelliae]|uniref:Uncharacterized protein n=1 Tax=Heyndrickxia camelliae TaxID=1707093 RepID=A0A2N3LQ92_9BACI|nr:hypothetical protein [Heyndrickxia camelliae]PKR86842.1 hypothetical protein CWO92_01955 [Heyndrickxia camelliae]
MSLKQLFHYFIKNDSSLKQLKKKVIYLEKKLEKYKEMESAVQELHKQKKEEVLQPPIVVERLNVEKLIVDKVELNNNFGQLGIKELKGRLNIGATYGEGAVYEHLKKENKEKNEESSSAERSIRKKNVQAPKVNVRAR